MGESLSLLGTRTTAIGAFGATDEQVSLLRFLQLVALPLSPVSRLRALPADRWEEPQSA